ncbi:MAG: ATP-binding protein [Calditrichae bacterium]|nr:ATP-binding protein [Calditrichia bacterium]
METILSIHEPISDISQFVGRQNLINKVYSRIGAARPQSVSLVGDYKIGKTSLLNFLSDPVTRSKYFDDISEYYCLRLSVTEELNSLESFVKELCYQIAHGLESEFKFESILDSYDWFKRIVEMASKRNRKIILFMDDFNLITQNESFPLEFFSFLRSLANNYNVAYVTTSYLDLQQLCVSKDVEESPFFNIFTNITIRPFDPDETDQFLKQACEIAPLNTEKSKILVKAYAGNFPYLLQIACNVIHDQDTAQRGAIQDDLFKQKYESLTKKYFELTWQNLNNDLQVILRQIAHKIKIENPREYLVQELVQKQLLIIDDSQPKIFSPSFLSFIKDLDGANGKSKSIFSGLLRLIGFK